MRRAVRPAAFALAAFLAAGALRAQSAAAPGYAFEIKVVPQGEATPRQYLCEATVKDLATGEVVFAPRLQVRAGTPGVASSSGEKGKRDYLLSVSIEGEGKQANCVVEIHDGETLIASQKASIKLR